MKRWRYFLLFALVLLPSYADWVKFDNADCWRFIVSGTEPLTRAEVFISYHEPNPAGVSDPNALPMPDLRESRLNLLTPISSLTDPYSELSGLEVPSEAEKLVVLVHGWNPNGPAAGDIGDGDSDQENHFACDPAKSHHWTLSSMVMTYW